MNHDYVKVGDAVWLEWDRPWRGCNRVVEIGSYIQVRSNRIDRWGGFSADKLRKLTELEELTAVLTGEI